MTTMIALVGEQQLPNYLPVRRYSPTHVLLVHTKRTAEPQYKNLKAVLERKKVIVSGVETEQKIKAFGVETDPYDISLISSAINRELVESSALPENKEFARAIKESDQLPMFNLTGGTKIMSLAAYQVAAQLSAPVIYLQSEWVQNLIDYYGWRDHQLCHQSQEKLSGYLSLQDMLDLHLGQGKDAAGRDRWRVEGPTGSNGGHLFEAAIAETLGNHGYEVMVGVKDSNGVIDTDIMIRYQNHVGIIEAKTKAGKTDHTFKGMQQLSTGMRYFGATYTRPFLVTNYELTNQQKQVCELLRIQNLIHLLQYRQDMVALSEAHAHALLTVIDKVMKPENRAEIK